MEDFGEKITLGSTIVVMVLGVIGCFNPTMLEKSLRLLFLPTDFLAGLEERSFDFRPGERNFIDLEARGETLSLFI